MTLLLQILHSLATEAIFEAILTSIGDVLANAPTG